MINIFCILCIKWWKPREKTERTIQVVCDECKQKRGMKLLAGRKE